jgi:hypothetical protein
MQNIQSMKACEKLVQNKRCKKGGKCQYSHDLKIVTAARALFSTNSCIMEELPAIPIVEELPAIPIVEELPAIPIVEELPAIPIVEELPAIPVVAEVPTQFTGRKSQCWHWINKGKCDHVKCGFSHPTIPCRNFATYSICQYGIKCNFLHAVVHDAAPIVSQEPPEIARLVLELKVAKLELQLATASQLCGCRGSAVRRVDKK